MRIDKKTELTEKSALAFFGRYLKEQKWKYNYSGDKLTIYSGFNSQGMLWDFSAYARSRGPGVFLLGIRSFIPNKALPERRAACAELLTRLNFSLSSGCFEMNYEDGEIRFRTGVIIHGTDITPGIVEHLVRSNLLIVEQHHKAIMSVLYSEVTPEAALKPKEDATEPKTEPRLEFN